MKTEAQKVAEGLSEAQREAVLNDDNGFLRPKYALAHITSGLQGSGLLYRRAKGRELCGQFTPLAREVRALLQETQP